MVRRPGGTAARTKEPEKGTSKRKRGRKPCCDVDVLAQCAVHSVLFQGGVECAQENGEHGGSRDRGGGSDQECEAGDEAGHTTTQSTADSEQPHNQFKHSGTKRNDISDKHPFRHSLVRVQRLLKASRQDSVRGAIGAAGSVAGTVQSPDSDGIEPKLRFGLGAKIDFEVSGAGLVSRAVAPKTDVVEVANGAGGDGFDESCVQGAAAEVGQVAECAGGLVGEGGAS